MQEIAPNRRILTIVAAALVCGLLAACSGVQSEAKYPTGAGRDQPKDDIYAEAPSIFGEGGLFGGGSSSRSKSEDSGIGVNSYLWRASLDTVSFMPLASADPFGGVILTDWYAPPETPDERLKLNVFILDRQLRASGVQVKVFRQVRRGGAWQDAKVADGTARQLEDAILTRARQLRVGDMGGL